MVAAPAMSSLNFCAVLVACLKRVGVDVAPALAAVPLPLEADGVGLVSPFAEAEPEEGIGVLADLDQVSIVALSTRRMAPLSGKGRVGHGSLGLFISR
jgi:hypothetical protein